LGLVLALPAFVGCFAQRPLHVAKPLFAAPPLAVDDASKERAEHVEPQITLTAGQFPVESSTAAPARPFLPTSAEATSGEGLQQREVTLADAVQVALGNNREVAVLGYAPREAATIVQTEEAVFDPTVNFDARMAGENQQLSQNVSTFGTGQNVQQRSLFGPSPGTPELFSVGRQFSTGTRARIGYLLDRSNSDPIGLFTTVNPAIQNQLGLTVEQPLLQGFGRMVNQAPILIAQSRQDQSQSEFQVKVQQIILNLKVAYWELYAAERDFRTRRRALEAAEQFLRGEHEKLKQGESDLASVAQAEAQTEQFRIDQLQAFRRQLDAERELRRLMGLPPADGSLLTTTSQPQIDLPKIHWASSVSQATIQRPELAAQRALVQAAEWDHMQRCNGLLPNVALVGRYAPHGLGSTFGDSLSSLGTGQFADWSVGVRFSYAMGRRADQAAACRAELAVARERAALRNLEFEIWHQLQQAYQDLYAASETLQLQGNLRAAAEKQLRAREALHKHGGYATTDLLLRAQSDHADAVRDEWLALGAFNQALARWQFALGEILTGDVEMISSDGGSRRRQQTAPTPQAPDLELLPPSSNAAP
jgi:outer membrane protein TolC